MRIFSNSEEYLLFCQEVGKVLSNVHDELIRFKADNDNKEILNSILHSVHTIHGISGYYELNEMVTISQGVENILIALIDGRLKADNDIAGLIKESSDYLSEMLEGAGNNIEVQLNAELAAKLLSVFKEKRGEYERIAEELSPLINRAIEYFQCVTAGNNNHESLKLFGKSLNTIKGISLFLEIDVIYIYARELGALIEDIVESSQKLDPESINIIFTGINHLKDLIEKYQKRQELRADDKMLQNIRSLFKNNDLLLFNQEMKKILASLNEALLKLETEPNNKTYLNQIFRQVRAIKGCAAYFKLEPIVDISAHMGKALDFLMKSGNSINSDIVEIMIQAIDYMTALSDSLIDGDPAADGAEIFISLEQISKIKDPGCIEETDKLLVVDEDNLSDFLISANELLEVLERNVFEYEKNDSLAVVNEIFRVVHTLKSDAGYVGLKPIADYSHILEGLLDKIRAGKVTRSVKIVDIILKSADILKTAVSALNAGNYEPVKNLSVNALRALISQLDCNINETGLPPREQDDSSSAFQSQILQYKQIISECVSELPLDSEKKKMLSRSLHSLQKAAMFVGQGVLAAGAEDLLEKLEENSGPSFLEALPSLFIKIDRIIADESKNNGTSGTGTSSGVQDITKQQSAESSIENEIRTMRVDETKIDHFTNLIGELLIAKNTYDYILNELLEENTLSNKYRRPLKENLHLFTRLSNELQSGVMALRMVPVKGIFQKFNRVIRDISKKQSKNIELITLGNETEVDKKVADALSEPLIHIIRNSCDHGIEMPGERKKKNKPEKGTIILEASQEGSDLIIKISDDGGGINRQKLIEKAVKMGFDISNYDDERILKLVFEPGLSTKSEVSDLSGRGVGMDVVMTTINKLNGEIRVISEENAGTEITLKIPMSIGISETLLVEDLGNIYAIPLDYITETLKLESDQLVRIHDRLGFNFRGEIFPADYLDNLLNPENRLSDIDYIYKTNLERDQAELSIVVLKTSKGRFGIIIDRFIRNVELSIKQVPESLSKIELISGVSILGDGKVVLVLNPEKLV